ncbi:MAG: hypothetical protein DI570_10340 [Phenylobacterium zucineum]|nr:MAG: hypothetical protein DI570_10340 [Phenylobacterium zucineum]
MTDADDDRLRALFASDAPPARDPAFSAEVMAAVARRRLLADLAGLAVAALVGGLVIWALWPLLGPAVVAASASLAPFAAALTVALLAWLVADPGMVHRLRRES